MEVIFIIGGCSELLLEADINSAGKILDSVSERFVGVACKK